MTLADAKTGQVIEICGLPESQIRSQAMRLGVFENARFTCTQSLRRGPVVLKNNYQEIAVGRATAQQITIRIIK